MIYGLLGVFTVIAVAIITVAIFALFTDTPIRILQIPVINLLTRFNGQTKVTRPQIGVMLENELMSRPFQKGLSATKIVYEAPTEGKITRFLGMFDVEELPERIGPIRSARTYFLDWAHEYNGVYAHVGGKADALARLRREKIYDADQFIYEKYFWRENTLKTALEHTMFTDGEHLLELIKDQGWDVNLANATDVTYPLSWLGGLGNYPEAAEITVDFGHPTYRVKYEYDSATAKYLRSQAGAPHIDNLTGKQISVGTVAVQRVVARSNNDAAGSISLKTIGEGEAVVFQKGHAIQGTWKKESLTGATRFFTKDGAEIPFILEPVWIEVLPVANTLTYDVL